MTERSSRRPAPRTASRLLAAAVAGALAASLFAVQTRAPSTPAAAASAACVPGVGRLHEADPMGGALGAALTDGIRHCAEIPGLEDPAELALAARGLSQRLGIDSPTVLAKAIAQKRAVGASVSPVPGGAGRWEPVGSGPEVSDDPAYETYAEGQPNKAGRISDFFLDEAGSRILAAVASGGIYESRDTGATWKSIGDRLPTQQVGSVVYTNAGGGRLIALTGDNAFGGYTYAGVGAFYSRNNGATWTRSRGIPNGAMGFKLAIDATNHSVIYAATGLGLYRSTNAGTSFTNVRLPTGPCAGKTTQRPCFLANIVTDVVVEAPDTFGHAGGAVLAVVGWRAGAFQNADGSIQSPQNGLYRSDNGKPGTFVNLDEDANGFAPQANIGRVEMGAATGPAQNHDYVYAIVQDPVLFNNGRFEGLDQLPPVDPLGLGIDPTNTATYLKGVYASGDFGKTWTLMASREDFMSPSSGSVLAQLQPLGFGPGIQTWYNEWIKPDPTRAVNGIPTRVVLGMEEIWENRTTEAPAVGPTDFHVIGAYVPNTGACLLVALQPTCAQEQSVATFNTTTHPDQHAGLWIPQDDGGVTLVVGNDGGAYVQSVGLAIELTQIGFGPGNQNGFHTLLPYGVDVANDGIIYAGLQDNGEIRIDNAGKQQNVRGGDGVFTVVDPKNSNTVWEETPGAGIAYSNDGGHTWHNAAPGGPNEGFYAPLVMDPLDSGHLVTGGRQVEELSGGPGNSFGGVYDLGTRLHPGQPPSGNLEPGDSQNQVSSVAVRGHTIYAGFCGGCDPVRDHDIFASGIATNAGGWHIPPARGLPDRIVTSVTIDPKDVRRIYVTLGSSTDRPYAPPGALGPDGVDANGGNLWMSTDAGNTFFDISGNLPRIGAGWTVLRGDQLLVGTTVGVFAAKSAVAKARPGHAPQYAVLGRGLPAAPVFSMSLKKNDPNTLVIATLGRGVYRYRFR